MKKKNIAALSLYISIISCTGNYLEINSYPYGATDEELERDGYIITSSLSGIAKGVISPVVNTAQYTECILGGTMSGYMADANSNFRNTISNYNPTDGWTKVFLTDKYIIPEIYANYNKLKQVTSDPAVIAIADIMRVAGMHRIVDTYGPIPYSKIGKDGKIQVPFDSEETIFNRMFKELDDAVNVLDEYVSIGIPATSDIIYSGNVEKWIKFANSLKLRLAMRIVYADRKLAEQMVKSAVEHHIGVMTSNEDNAYFSSFGVKGNPLNVAVKYNMVKTHDDGSICTTGGDSHAAADIICYMNGYKDPRRAVYFTESEWGPEYKYVGLRRGIVIPDHATIGHRYSGIEIGPDDKLCWMNAAEVSFLMAEAKAVFGFDISGDARTYYENGIRLSFEQYGVQGADTYILDENSVPENYLDPAGTNSYDQQLSTVTIAWNESDNAERKQERIIIQKWIANWLLGNESWADVRRTGYPRLIPATQEGNKSNGLIDSEEGPGRLPYPADEYINNAENIRYAVQEYLGAPDNMKTKLWWDCK